jgi:hypothetical protein
MSVFTIVHGVGAGVHAIFLILAMVYLSREQALPMYSFSIAHRVNATDVAVTTLFRWSSAVFWGVIASFLTTSLYYGQRAARRNMPSTVLQANSETGRAVQWGRAVAMAVEDLAYYGTLLVVVNADGMAMITCMAILVVRQLTQSSAEQALYAQGNAAAVFNGPYVKDMFNDAYSVAVVNTIAPYFVLFFNIHFIPSSVSGYYNAAVFVALLEEIVQHGMLYRVFTYIHNVADLDRAINAYYTLAAALRLTLRLVAWCVLLSALTVFRPGTT